MNKLHAEHPPDQTKRERFRSLEERRPRDAWPVSVVFGVEVGQVLVSPFAQRPLLLRLLAAAAARDSICARHGMLLLPLLWVPLVATPKHENRLLYAHSCSMSVFKNLQPQYLSRTMDMANYYAINSVRCAFMCMYYVANVGKTYEVSDFS